MRHRTSLVLRLFAMLALAFGFAGVMVSSAAAQETATVQCNATIGGTIYQGQDCVISYDADTETCTVAVQDGTFTAPASVCQEALAGECPTQTITEEGNIIQFICDDPEPTETPVTPDATETPVTPDATETPVTPDATETPVTPDATETPVTPDATETPVTPNATETPVTPGQGEEPVDELPETGAGSTSEQGDSTVMLLGAVSVLLLVAGVAWQRREA